MNTFRRLFLEVDYEYTDPLDIQRARLILLLNVILFSFWILTMFLFVLPPVFSGESANIGATTFVLILLPTITLMYYLVRSGRVNIAAWILVSAITGTILVSPLGSITDWESILITVPIIMAGTLLSGTGLLLITLISLAAVVTGMINDLQIQGVIEIIPSEAAPTTAFIVTVGIITIVAIMSTLGRTLAQIVGEILNSQARSRNSLSMLVGEQTELNQDTLIRKTLNVLRNEMNMNVALIYLADSSGQIVQRVYSGLNNDTPLIRETLAENPPAAITEAASSLHSVRITPRSSDIQRQHLTAGTRFGVAIPLIRNEECIGVIDVHSEEDKVFTNTDLNTLEIIAQILSTNLQQEEIISEAQRNITEQQGIILRQRARLRELERREGQTVTEAWNRYLQQRGLDLLGFDISEANATPIMSMEVPPEMIETLQDGEMIIEDKGDYQLISMPIELRGQVIGAISFKTPAQQAFTDRQRDLLRNVIQRLSLALENKRLFEQSQSQAQRESQANSVGSLLLQTTDVDTLMKLAAESFNNVLGAIQTQIHLSPDISEAGTNRPTEEAR